MFLRQQFIFMLIFSAVKMMWAIILLAVLFLIGFINTFFNIPPNKLFLWIQSYFPKSNTTLVLPTEEELMEKKKSSSGSSVTVIDDDNGHGKAELERVFACFDKNGDGFITKQELGDSLKNIGLFTSETEVGSMVGKLYVNGDGLIDINEFCELYESIMGKREKVAGGEREEENEEEEELMREAFDVFDGDKDGLISVEELGTVLKSLGIKEGMIRDEECKEMIRKVDLDGDGMVNFDEFKMMMMMKSGSNLVQVS